MLAGAVIVAGGDGTVREAANGLAGRDTPLAILPGGTENLVARYFGCDGDPGRTAEAVLSDRRAALDVGSANGRMFLVVAGFGFDAEVVERVHAGRRGHISHASYYLPLFRTLASHRYGAMRVEAEGEVLCDEPALVFLGNLPRYALGLRVARDARCDDGMLDVCIFRCDGRARLIAHAWRTVWRRHVGGPGVIYRRARQVAVTASRPTPYELDGDIAGVVWHGAAELENKRLPVDGFSSRRQSAVEWTPRVEFSVRRAALRLCVP
ncbi:MAG: hypothetical protein HUU26_01510 [Gemmatimonadaceae bacterium]|nr:hypothetical protein [Gemmatimonadaceae bacterium]